MIEKIRRSDGLDQLRGLAVVLMLIFHFVFDLAYLEFISIDPLHHPFWGHFPDVIVSLFMFCMGASLYLAHGKEMRWKKFFRRWFKLAGAALLISLTTFFLFPTQWIYFGTLHSLTVCSLLALPFLKIPNIAFFIGLAILLPELLGLFQWPWFRMDHLSMDYIPPLPWLSLCLFGITRAHHQKIPTTGLLTEDLIGKSAIFLGRKSLLIYLIHQPVLLFSLFSVRFFV